MSIGENGSSIDWDAFERELAEAAEAEKDESDDLDELQDYYSYMPKSSSSDPGNDKDSLIELGKKINEDIEDDEIIEFHDTITDEDVYKNASILYPEKKVYRSLLLETFTPDQCIILEKLARTFSITNNQKAKMIMEHLNEWGIEFNQLGGGTNRLGLMLDGYVVKIACDKDGKIDNKREFIYSLRLYPYVIKCYEVYADGLIAVFEYVEIFTIDDFYKNQESMRKILSEIAKNFLIGDVGISSTNYVNWGFRGEECVILDYAYIYDVSFKTFRCPCSLDSTLYYDKDFNNLICPVCGKRYSFKEIRKKISRKDQDDEIGDLYQRGYVLDKEEDTLRFNPKFVYGAFDAIFEKLMKVKKKQNERNKRKKQKPSYDGELLSMEQILENIRTGKWRM